MIKQFADFASPILEFPFVRRTRRNHALEHATIHILTSKIKHASMAGRSSENGFVLFGNVPTEQLEDSVREALKRLEDGERRLALHPNCGTNLVTAGLLTTFVGWAGLRTGEKRLSLDRLSWTVTLMMLAIIASQPLGMKLQEHITTKGEPGDLEFVEVKKRQMNWPFQKHPLIVHNVITRYG